MQTVGKKYEKEKMGEMSMFLYPKVLKCLFETTIGQKILPFTWRKFQYSSIDFQNINKFNKHILSRQKSYVFCIHREDRSRSQ